MSAWCSILGTPIGAPKIEPPEIAPPFFCTSALTGRFDSTAAMSAWRSISGPPIGAPRIAPSTAHTIAIAGSGLAVLTSGCPWALPGSPRGVLSHPFCPVTPTETWGWGSEFGRVPGVKRHPSTMPLPGESLCSRGCPEITGARVGSPVIVSGVTPPLTKTMPGSDCPMLPTLNEPPLSTLNEPPTVGGEPLVVPWTGFWNGLGGISEWPPPHKPDPVWSCGGIRPGGHAYDAYNAYRCPLEICA